MWNFHANGTFCFVVILASLMVVNFMSMQPFQTVLAVTRTGHIKMLVYGKNSVNSHFSWFVVHFSNLDISGRFIALI